MRDESFQTNPAPSMPASQAQYGIWLGQQLAPDNPAYWCAEAICLSGELNLVVFELALRQAVQETPALHARFELQGNQLQQSIVEPLAWPLPLLDCRQLSATQTETDARFSATPAMAQAYAWMQADLSSKAELAGGPLFASALLRVANDCTLWYLRVHHIALDGFGFALFEQRVASLYSQMLGAGGASHNFAAATAPLQALREVINEDLAYQQSAAFTRDQAFWCQTLQSSKAIRGLGALKPLSATVRRQRGKLASQQFAALQALSQHSSAPDWTCLLIAAIACWLHASTGSRHLVLGLPVMNRLGSKALQVPCMHMNIVPLVVKLNPEQSWLQLALEIQASMRSMRAHQRFRYEDMKPILPAAASGASTRLFSAVINLMPFQQDDAFGDAFANLKAQFLPIAAGPVEDLAINLAPCKRQQAEVRHGEIQQNQAQITELRLDFEANPAAYQASELQAHQQNLLACIDALLQAPTQSIATCGLPVCGPALALLSGPALQHPAADVLHLIAQTAARQPHHVALEQNGQTLTYAQLMQAVAGLASVLSPIIERAQAKQGSRVILLLPRQPETIIAMLAVLYCNGAYIALDPQGPTQRLATILAEHPHCLLISQAQYQAKLSHVLAPGQVCHMLDALINEVKKTKEAQDSLASNMSKKAVLHTHPQATQDPAYLIYTSGSTGKPNGVMISRAALAHFVAAAGQRYAISQLDRVLQFAPLHFDACIEEIFVTLCHGGSLVLRDEAMLSSSARFLASCQELAISVLDLPTAFWHELAFYLSSASDFPQHLRLVIIGGEAVLAERVARWRRFAPQHVELINTYGPTETTVICSSATLAGPNALRTLENRQPPIGQPLPGLHLAVCDVAESDVAVSDVTISDAQLLRQGEPGELCVLGPSLALGYWQRASVQAARFVALPALQPHFSSNASAPIAYRTGDKAVLAEDGQLYYLGRLDHELKISGHRIDPSEIEACLLQFPAVRAAAVVWQATSAGGTLRAFVSSDSEIAATLLRDFLAQYLAPPAIPQHFQTLAALPLNANGKIDRHALLAMQLPEQHWQNTPNLPETDSPLQRKVLEIWRAVLGLPSLHANDDFFALGGRSLQAIQVANRLSVALQQEVAVAVLYRYPTVSSLVGALQHQLLPTSNASDTTYTTPSDIGELGPAYAPILKLQAAGPQAIKLFCLPPAEGLAWCYMGLAAHLPEIELIGLQAPSLSLALSMPERNELNQASNAAIATNASSDIERMLEQYQQAIRSVQPHGPYYVLGWSSGGGMAQALASRLQAEGETVAMLALLDAYPSSSWRGKPAPSERDALVALLDVLGASDTDSQQQPLSSAAIFARLQLADSPFAQISSKHLQALVDCAWQNMRAFRQLQHTVLSAEVLFFHALQRTPQAPHWQDWLPYLSGPIQHIEVDSTHSGLCQAQSLAVIGPQLHRTLQKISAIHATPKETI